MLFTRGCVVGGIRNFGLSVAQNIEDVIIDFLVFTEDEKFTLPELENNGGRVILIRSKADVYSMKEKSRNVKQLYKVLKEYGPYDAIHCNITSKYSDDAMYLFIAKLVGVKIRILHSHQGKLYQNQVSDKSVKLKIYEFTMEKLYRYAVTDQIGCSELAYDSLFNETNRNVYKHIIYNGINVNQFRNKYKHEQKIEDISYCSIGRFSEQKNFLFLIDVFYYIHKKYTNTKLNIVGYGEMEKEIRNQIKKYGLEKAVNIYPRDTNVSDFLEEQNVYLMTSLYEGYPITLIEAQVAGVRCFVSKNVTEEVNIGLCQFIEGYNAEKWTEIILKNIIQSPCEDNYIDYQKADEKKMALELQKIYERTER